MRQNKLRVFVHFVWATWDRQPLITEAIENDLYRYVQGVCEEHQSPVLAIGGMPDHVHLLVALSNTIALSGLMKYVKGGSSRYIAESLLPGEGFKWQGNYGDFSVSPHDKDRVIRYIQNQKHHHSNGSLWSHAESSWEGDPPDTSARPA